MNSKKAGPAIAAILVIAGALAGLKHAPSVLPSPAVVPVDLVTIDAPDTAAVGELVVLSVQGSGASSFSWQVEPPTQHFLVIDKGQRAVFSATAPGEYLFMVGGAKGDASDLKTHKITVTAGVTVPPADDVPAKVTTLAKIKNLPRLAADKIASVFSSVSAAATSGALSDPADIVDATKRGTQSALGPAEYIAAKPFLQSLQTELNALAAAGRLSDTAAHAQAWRQIADALRDYAESK
jgi:hypothetical protein